MCACVFLSNFRRSRLLLFHFIERRTHAAHTLKIRAQRTEHNAAYGAIEYNLQYNGIGRCDAKTERAIQACGINKFLVYGLL